MSTQTSVINSTTEPHEDLLDFDISGAEALLANIQEPAAEVSRPVKKPRQKRLCKTPSSAPPTKKMVGTVHPKITLRPLLETHDDKGVLSNRNARDIFYAIMDSVQDIKKKQDRIEDRLRKIDERTYALELWTRRMDQKKMEPQPASACPAVAPTRYCEVCFVAGHQAADCRSKSRMDVAHVEEIYKKKGICKKCHCIHE
ncbi:hypothetical protein GCK32_022666 [Trichostrongylus colubriformis]|uniref:Uncharacterized protein n=1 Tax=Trichostrongylus colubriformis TaxID=6319 RepID=A0AAN8F5B2_TRICO